MGVTTTIIRLRADHDIGLRPEGCESSLQRALVGGGLFTARIKHAECAEPVGNAFDGGVNGEALADAVCCEILPAPSGAPGPPVSALDTGPRGETRRSGPVTAVRPPWSRRTAMHRRCRPRLIVQRAGGRHPCKFRRGPGCANKMKVGRYCSTEAAQIAEARSFQASNPTWFDGSFPRGDPVGHVRGLTGPGNPISTRDIMPALRAFKTVIVTGCARSQDPDGINNGGVNPVVKIAPLVASYRLPATSRGADDITAQLRAAGPIDSDAEARAFGLEDYVEEPLGITKRHATAPDRPGHGVELDWARLKSLMAKTERGDP